MRQGGRALRWVKQQLVALLKPGSTAAQIETAATELITQGGFRPSFSTVEGYQWTTCVMKNDALCHGIPVDQRLESGDVVTVDLGLINQGYHLDTTITEPVGPVSPQTHRFLEAGRAALAQAIDQARDGATVWQISRAIQRHIERQGYSPVYQLTGHGIGRRLHDEPAIPCVAHRGDKNVKLSQGQTLAIEVMYAQGNAAVVLDDDGWTYRTRDGSLSAMFEETVLVTTDRPEVLT